MGLESLASSQLEGVPPAMPEDGRPYPSEAGPPLLLEGQFGLQVHWFGRFAGYPEWRIDRVRLAVHMTAFFFVQSSSCWCELNGKRLKISHGELLIIRGATNSSSNTTRVSP